MLLASRSFLYIFCFLLVFGINAEDVSITKSDLAPETNQPSGLKFSVVFHNNTNHVFYPDTPTSILIGIHNTEKSSYNITSISASLRMPSTPSVPVKMFRPNEFRQIIPGDARISMEYHLFIDNMITPQSYILSLHINYTVEGDQQEFSSIICQEKIEVADISSYTDWMGLAMLLVVVTVVLYFAFKPLKSYTFKIYSYLKSFKPHSRKKVATSKRAN